MKKTTVYLTSEQKAALARVARAEGRSEARLIRDGIDALTTRHQVTEAAIPLVDGDQASRVSDDRPARRPRWMSREEFGRRFVDHPADTGLRTELRELSPDTTDDVMIR